MKEKVQALAITLELLLKLKFKRDYAFKNYQWLLLIQI